VFEEHVSEVSFVPGHTKHATGFCTEVTANLHLSCQGHHGYANLILHVIFQGVVDVARIAGRQRSEDNEDLS
jgi:hypothetical protein